ncbi:MAG TPA: hypothetical protein VK577_04730 [Bradyrhizobium sp.]|nr:hypothetical protein [Bradyrhizobium sp.]
MKLPILTGFAKRKLTPVQARFVLDCLTVSFQMRRADGFQRRRKGVYQELAAKFSVSVSCIKKIAERQSWRTLRLTQLYDIKERSR